jgi:hypothetical protein
MRISGVKLVAETAAYKREMKDSAKVTDDTKESIEDLGTSSKKTGRDVDDLGGDFRDTAKDARALKGEIREVEARLRALAHEFAAADTAANRMEIAKSFQRQQGELRQLLSMDKLLPQPAEVQSAGKRFGLLLGGALSNGLDAVKTGPVIAAGAAAAAPLIGASIAGAVVGGAGIGGVIGGLAIVAKDPRVKAAGKTLGAELLTDLQRRAEVFVDPVLRNIGKVRRAWQEMGGDVSRIFDQSADNLDPLVDGLLSGTRKFTRGFADAVSASGPVIDALGDSFDRLLGAGGVFFTKMADNADEGAMAIRDLTDAMVGLVDTTGDVASGLAKTYGWIQKFNDATSTEGILDLNKAQEAEARINGVVAETFKKVTEATAETAAATDEKAEADRKAKLDAASLAAASRGVSTAQQGLASSLSLVTARQDAAAMRGEKLKSVMDSLYGAAIRQTDANEDYEASWDDLSDAVKANGRSLDIHTRAGRSNRDSLQALLRSSNELYIADITAGVATEKATKKHQARTAAVREEARRVGFNKDETNKLITTYGRIPGKKTTDLVLEGVRSIVQKLYDLYVLQRALAEGRSVASMEQKIRTGSDSGPAKRNGGFAAGGFYDGMLPGRPSSVDNLTGLGPRGDMFGLAGGEYIVNARQTAKHKRTLDAINRGEDGFAAGGFYPVDTSRRWRFRVDGSDTRVPSRHEVESKVTPPVPSGHISDWIVRVVRQAFPGMAVLSKDRPGARTLSGNVSYHARGRAVDFPPSRPLAEWWNLKYKARTKELITPWNDLNIHNGRRHAYSGAVYRQHNFAGGNAHDHIAMLNGGVIREPVVGVGMSGRTYSFAEDGRPETVTRGLPQYQTARSTPAAGNTTVIHLTAQLAAGANPREAGRQIAEQLATYLNGGGTVVLTNGTKVLP